MDCGPKIRIIVSLKGSELFQMTPKFTISPTTKEQPFLGTCPLPITQE